MALCGIYKIPDRQVEQFILLWRRCNIFHGNLVIKEEWVYCRQFVEYWQTKIRPRANFCLLWRWWKLNPHPGFGPKDFYLNSRFGISSEAKKPTK